MPIQKILNYILINHLTLIIFKKNIISLNSGIIVLSLDSTLLFLIPTGGEQGVLARYEEAGVKAKATARKNIRYRGMVFSFGQTAPVAGYALSLWYGGVLVANKEVPYKDVIK